MLNGALHLGELALAERESVLVVHIN